MNKHILSVIFITGLIFLGVGCKKADQPQTLNQNIKQETATSSDAERMAKETALANPASVNCLEKGGKLSLQKTLDGSTEGICILPDNTLCEEWALFRGQCGPKNSASSTTPINQNAGSTATSTHIFVEEQQGADVTVLENKLKLEVNPGEEAGELITKWTTDGLNTDDGFIIMLSGKEDISYPTKYLQVVKNPKSRAFTWINLVSGRKYFFLICVAQGDKCGTSYSRVVSEIAQ